MAFVGQRLEAHQRQQEIDSAAFQVAMQQLESIFIALLGFHHEAVKSIAGKFEGGEDTYGGRVFFFFFEKF